MLLVVADDLTGAAEMGGIAWRQGATAVVVREKGELDAAGEADVVVVDTASRLLPGSDAARRVKELVGRAVSRLRPDRVFKKIDSAFRGPIGAELRACLDVLGCDSALLLVASPATQRYTIKGIHYVAGQPLAETEFGRDPVQPITESHLPTVLSKQMDAPVTSAAHPDSLEPPTTGVVIADARTDADIDSWARALPEDSLAVGSAAFGRALLSLWEGPRLTPAVAQNLDGAAHGATLILSGTLAAAGRRQLETFRRSGGVVMELSGAVAPTQQQVARALKESGAVALTSPSKQSPSSELAASGSVADRLAHVAADVLEQVAVETVVVAGGHTAGCLLRRLGWRVLTVTGEFAQGIVRLQPVGGRVAQLILKPGSYGDDDLYVRLLGRRHAAGPNRPSV